MNLSDSERRSWAEIETELSKEGQLAVLSRRLSGMPSRLVILCWAIGVTVGLAVGLTGFVVGSRDLMAVGVVILTATQVLNGIALIATGVSDIRRQRGGVSR